MAKIPPEPCRGCGGVRNHEAFCYAEYVEPIKVGDAARRGHSAIVHRVEYVFPDGVVWACSVRRYPPERCTVVGPSYTGPFCRKGRCWPIGTPYGLARVPTLPPERP